MLSAMLAIVHASPSAYLSVCHRHAGIVSKWLKLRSCSLQCRIVLDSDVIVKFTSNI